MSTSDLSRAIVVAVYMAVTTACGSTDEQAAGDLGAKSESAPTGESTAIYTAAPPTIVPTNPPVTATEIAPRASPSPGQIGVVVTEADPTATSVAPTSSPTLPATPTVSVPTGTSAPSNAILAGSSKYGPFAEELQNTFQAAVDIEFATAPEKAALSVAVYTKDTMWSYATGIADTEVDIAADTPILIGSTSKTFVSALLLTQIENGRYTLNDSLETVLSDHPDYSSFDQSKVNPAVTIAEMMSMTSGLADYNENFKGKAGLFSAISWRPADNINLLQSPYEEPGAFQYVDTNLVLLGLIAELHGGQDLYTLYRETFLEPLGVTAVFLSPDTTPPNTARPYDDLSNYGNGFGNLIDAAPYSFDHYITGQGRIRWACCGIVSTAADMARWGYELYSAQGSAISEASRSVLLNSLSEAPVSFQGSAQHYGYFIAKRNFTLGDASEVTAYGHPGGGGGYSSLLRYSPELDLAVSVLANSPLKFQGSCGDYAPRSCIAAAIFGAYAQ